MAIIARLLLIALTLLVVGKYIPGIELSGVYAAIVASIVLALLNVFVRPVLVLLTLPINILTLGVFSFVINAGLFWFAASFLAGFTVSGFLPAVAGSLVVTLVSALGARYIR